jgi:hypothetical protein
MNDSQPRPINTRLLFCGAALTVIGALFLLDRLGLVDVYFFFRRFWPLFIIMAGASRLFSRRSAWSGVWLIGVGGWLQIATLHLFGMTFNSFWPLLLIGLGGGVILRALLDITRAPRPGPATAQDPEPLKSSPTGSDGQHENQIRSGEYPMNDLKRRPIDTDALFWGLALVGFGILQLSIPHVDIFSLWPLLVIHAGLSRLFGSGSRRAMACEIPSPPPYRPTRLEIYLNRLNDKIFLYSERVNRRLYLYSDRLNQMFGLHYEPSAPQPEKPPAEPQAGDKQRAAEEDAKPKNNGLYLLVIGVWLQMVELHVYGLTYHSWPLLLVCLGALMIVHAVIDAVRATPAHAEGKS